MNGILGLPRRLPIGQRPNGHRWMVWSVSLRPASHKLPSLGVYRSIDGINSLNRRINCMNWPIDGIHYRLMQLIIRMMQLLAAGTWYNLLNSKSRELAYNDHGPLLGINKKGLWGSTFNHNLKDGEGHKVRIYIYIYSYRYFTRRLKLSLSEKSESLQLCDSQG